jgi:hypothetical protein
LKRKADNSGWIRLNFDNMTEHQSIKKKKQQPPVITGSASTAAPLPVASGLERKLDALIEEVQALRLELQKRN